MTVLVAIDESTGVQNTTQSGVTSNDTDVAIPTRFNDALAAEGAGSGSLSLQAVSGSTSATSTGTSVLTFGANTTDVAFTDGSGGALVGVASGLSTTDGTPIYLYTSTFDDNMVVGRLGVDNGSGFVADPNGTVAFAAFLDTGITNTSGDGDLGATSAKVWLMQFDSLHHLDPTKPNDILYLTGLLNVSVTSPIEFSAAGAPSGQNLFMMFGDGSPTSTEATVIVTGWHPADQSDGASITTGDTVNSGKGGGMTTLGTNNQMVDPNEALYFTFVKGANTDYVVPNLDQNEADVEANISFTSYFGATSASFEIAQLQPPKSATVEITASIAGSGNTSNNLNTNLNAGTDYVDHLNDNTAVDITSVTVTRQGKHGGTTGPYTFSESDNVSQAGITVDFTGDSAKITGILQGDRITYTTATQHDRVLIENAGNTDASLNAAFDIGGFRLESGQVQTTALGDLAFVDDAPTAAAALGTGSVVNDETAGLQTAAGANDTDSSTVAALFSGVTNTSTQLSAAEYAQGGASVIDSSTSVFGADGQAASNATVYSLAVASTGVSSGLTTDDGTSILLYKEGDLVVGRIGSDSGAAAFAVSIDATTGVLSMAQYSAVKHATTTDSNESTTVTNTALQAVVTVTDGDGDQNTASVNIGSQVKILDDGPTAGAALGTGSVVNDETAGVQSAAGANDSSDAAVAALFSGVTNASTQLATAEYAQGTAAVINSSTSVFGVDGEAASNATVYSLAVSAAGVDSGLTNDAGTAILLYKEGNLVVGRVGSDSGAAAFAVSIDASTGVLSMAQYSAVKHATTTDPNDSTHVANTALKAVVTVTDGDGDTSTASVNIGDQVKILDDGPSAGAALGTGSVINDETAGVQALAGANDTSAPAVIALFSGVTNTSTQLTAAEYAQGSAAVINSSTSDFGSDGQATSNAKVYSLAIASTGVDSGLTDDAGTAILLYKEGDLVIGRLGSDSGAAAFAVSIDASTGVLSMAQYSAVKHATTTDSNDSASIANTALQAVVTVTDGDGDHNTASVNIGSQVKILDDGPSAGAALGTGSVVNDETAGLQTAAGANDTDSSTVAALFSGVTNTSTQLTVAEYAQGTAAVINSSSSVFGVDGQAASNATVYSLALSAAGVNSGLTNDAGTSILLYKEGDLVVGRIGSDSGAAAFAVSIDASTGVLSMAQYSAVKHATTTDPNDSTHVANTALKAVVTVTDGDGDTSTASVNIGDQVKILDDGPSAAAALGTGSVVNDETAGLQSASGANDTSSAAVAALFSGVTNTSTQLAAAEYAQGTAGVVDSSGSTFGVDGQATSNAKVYSLAIGSTGVDSGLTNDAGTAILLYKEGNLVVGRIGSDSGAAAFAVAIDAGTGVLSMSQYSAVKHATTTDSNDSASITDTALQAVVTVKDGDGDTSTVSVDIGNKVSILDDGPTLAFGNVIGTGAVDPQYGYWSMAPGVDKLGANGLDVTLDSFQLVKPGGTVVTGTSSTFSEDSLSPDSNGAYHFTGSLTGDFDNNAATADTTEHFTLTAYANGSYAIDLVEGFKSTTTESTANGSLAAGGPSAVQTLVIGSDNVEFFSTKPLATDAQIVAAIGEGLPDPSKATLLAGNYPAIDYTKPMNVSTSGIGNANNNLQGDGTAGITSGDESFTANPGTQFTSAKVFIDNSLQGYSHSSGEELYYTLWYADGTKGSGPVLVTNDLGLANKGQATYFTADGGGKLIDAIQLTMASGTVKIPEIQFVTQINNLANGIKLGFTSTIADGDGDTASSSFVTNLAANALGTSFDYVLTGITSKADAFNVDLAPTENKYEVNGFEVGSDKLVLLGANSYTLDTSTADTVVDVTETGGSQHTYVTIVGVHIGASDIATIA